MSGLFDDKYLLNLLNADFFFQLIRVKTLVISNINLIRNQLDSVDFIIFTY